MGALSAILASMVMVMVMVMLSPVDGTGHVMKLRKRVTSSHWDRAVSRDSSRHPRLFSGIVSFPIFGNPSYFALGCNTYEFGRLMTTFTPLDGILGFSQGSLSIISQLSKKHITPAVFSHCLRGDANGTLVLGEVVEPGISYTPLLPSGPHYNVDLRGISVNGVTVFVTRSAQKTIIDSGSTLGYLVEEAFDALVTAAVQPSATPIRQGELQCFGVTTGAIFPAVSLNFAGGASMQLRLEDYLIDSGLIDGVRQWCIGFQKAQLNILGEIILKDKLVAYDIERRRLGWTNYNCSLPLNVSTVYTADSTGALCSWVFIFLMSLWAFCFMCFF